MPKVELKQPVIEEIASVVQDADSVVLVNYSGLTVEQDTQLRRNMREAGVTYKVYKNTMMNFAFKDTPYEELCKDLKGTNALAVSKDDATAPARLITEFAKKAPVIELVSAVVEGKYYNTDEVKALAQVPSREVLLSKLLGSLQSPIANLARVLNQIAEQGGAPAAAEAPAEEAPAEAAAEAPAEEAPAEETAEAPAEEAPAEEAAEAPAEEAPAEETTEEPAAE